MRNLSIAVLSEVQHLVDFSENLQTIIEVNFGMTLMEDNSNIFLIAF